MADKKKSTKKRGRPPVEKADKAWFDAQIAMLEARGQLREAEQLRAQAPKTFRADKPASAFRERVRVEPDGTEAPGSEFALESPGGGWIIDPDKRRQRTIQAAIDGTQSFLKARKYQTEEIKPYHGQPVYGPPQRRWDDAYVERLREKAEASCLALRAAWQRRGGHFAVEATNGMSFLEALAWADSSKPGDDDWPDVRDSLNLRALLIVEKVTGVALETLRPLSDAIGRSRLSD